MSIMTFSHLHQNGKTWAAESYSDHGNVLVMTLSLSPQKKKKKSNISVITSPQPSWAEKVSSFFPSPDWSDGTAGAPTGNQERKGKDTDFGFSIVAVTDSRSIYCVYHVYFNTAHAPIDGPADKYVRMILQPGMGFSSHPFLDGIETLHFAPC